MILLPLYDTIKAKILILLAAFDTIVLIIKAQCYIQVDNGIVYEVDNLSIQSSHKSLSLVMLLLLSSFTGLIALPSASAVNETNSGTITGTETWSGTMNLNGDILVAEGSKLIVNAGTTINIPYGKFIDVAGAICIGDTACGASSGSASNKARFVWSLPSDSEYTKVGRCYDNTTSYLNNIDAACGSGMIIRSTINQALTSINFAHYENAYGIPMYVSSIQSVQYGALVFEGSSTTANGISFTDINTSNVLAVDFASPLLKDSSFTLGVDGREYDAAAVRAYGAGAGILATFRIENSVFTGDDSDDCGQQGGGRSLIYLEDSYIGLNNLEVRDNTYGLFLKGSSGYLSNSTVTTKCNAIDTNSHKETGNFKHTLTIDDTVITTAEGAGITAYDGAIVVINNVVISGASDGSGIGVSSSTLEIHHSTIGPIGGWNGLWIYGTSDVVAENNTILNTAKEPILIGEYHFKDQGWQVPSPTAARLYLANNIISNNSGICNSQMYGGDFPCPAVHVFMSSATIYDNTISGNQGDIIRAKGSIVNVQRNVADTAGAFAANISHYDDNYGNKFGSIGYFSGNTWTNASQIYNITESRVTVQSEYIPDPSAGELYPVSIRWLGAECPWVQDECLQVPPTKVKPPRFMPLALEVVENSTVFSYADLQNFDSSKVHTQAQNSAWGAQVREGELVRYQVKAKNSNVAGATVVISDANGLPLYTLETDSFGFTQQVSLPSDFLLDRNWNHRVGETNVTIPGTNVTVDENSCADGYDNDGDTFIDSKDLAVDISDTSNCENGNREMPFYSVSAYKFGKGTKDFNYVLSGPIDDVINLYNRKPSVTVEQNDGFSFAITAVLTGSAWDGHGAPYANDIIAYDAQFGLVKKVEIQPPGSNDWYSAVDTSQSNGEITLSNHPFRTWSFTWDLSAHPEGEGDVTFRVRSYDGLDYSPVEVRKFKLNLVAPTILVDTPNDGTSHDSGRVIFSGTASDPYSGTWGSDIKGIWFDITGPDNSQGDPYRSHFDVTGSTAWSYEWHFDELPTGQYTFEIWASDSDFCIDLVGTCSSEMRTLQINNDNQVPIVQISEPLDMDLIRASEDTIIQGVARDNDGQVTRVEIEIFDLASGYVLNSGPNPVTNFAPNGAWSTVWDTSDLIHDQQYELVVRAYDGEDYSAEVRNRIIIDNPTDLNNMPPIFNDTGWASTVTIFCDAQSSSIDRCGSGAVIDLTKYFSDPDGIGSTAEALAFDIYDDLSNLDDDDYGWLFTISAQGVATYNPTTRSDSTVSEWSLVGVIFEARDIHDSVIYSHKVNIVVKSVSFSVQRVDTGDVDYGQPAQFIGQGLPGSTVKALIQQGGMRVNSTRVLSDGTWAMDISTSQLNTEGTRNIIFEMDGQTFQDPDTSADQSWSLSVASESGATGGIMTVVLVIIAVIAILAAGAFFFIEFEDLDEDEVEVADQTAEVEEDTYAWGKAKLTPELPVAAIVPESVQQAATPEVSQHPGWLWDAETNQWVADPNFQQ